MSDCCEIRLKIEITPECKRRMSLADNTDEKFLKFWFYVDTSRFATVEQLQLELVKRTVNNVITNNVNNIKTDNGGNCHQNGKNRHISVDKIASCSRNLRLFVENCELPLFESTRLLKDMDVVVIKTLEPETFSKKRKQDELGEDEASNHNTASEFVSSTTDSSPPPKKVTKLDDEDWDIPNTPSAKQNAAHMAPFKACLIGTSMVRNIRYKDLFGSDLKTFFKSISGGLIKHVDTFLRSRANLLNQCNIFVITCGSNDCDSTSDMASTLSDYLNMCRYLNETFPAARLVLNTLIPRQRCKYATQDEFEQRRVVFNNFLVSTVTGNFVTAQVVPHPGFENRDSLGKLLNDGIHLSVDHGLPIYVEEIRAVLKDEAGSKSLNAVEESENTESLMTVNDLN